MFSQNGVHPVFNEKILKMDEKKERRKMGFFLLGACAVFFLLFAIFLNIDLPVPRIGRSAIFMTLCTALTGALVYVHLKYQVPELDAPLSGEEAHQISLAMNYYPEIEKYIEDAVNGGKLLTKRDYYYLNIDNIKEQVLDFEALKKIKEFADIVPITKDGLSEDLKQYAVAKKVFSFEDDKVEQSKRRKIALVCLVGSIVGLFVLAFASIKLFFPPLVWIATFLALCLVLILSFAFAVTGRNLIGINKLKPLEYSALEEICKYDSSVVEYLQSVRDQGRVLYSKDYDDMSLGSKYAVIEIYKSTQKFKVELK
ncbi:TPA: hypothetical protein ACJEU7_001500 [Acinetobacter baumannii]